MRPKRTATGVLAGTGALSFLLLIVLASVAVSSAFATTFKPTFAQPYPWSHTASSTTGDYIADSYNGVSAGHVFENVTTDRLLDILSSNGNYYIVLAGPEHPTSQAAIAAINAQAQADGITRIYHFDPYVDGYRLDISDTTSGGVGSWTGGTSVNYSGAAKVHDVWNLITSRLPASAVATGGALNGYSGDQTLLLSVSINDRTSVATGTVINASYKLAPAELASFDTTTARTAISAVFHHGPGGTVLPATERTQYQFFKRLYDGSASYTNTTSTPTADKIGGPVTIFSDTDFPSGAGFPLVSVDIKQAYDMLNSPGEHAFLFAGQGCHNTQAIIGSVALRAKQLGLSKVYVVDFALDSNVKFGTGSLIDTVSKNAATGGLWVRAGVNTSTGANKFSYLYGELVKYFGNGWITENSSKKNNSIAYYPNGAVDGTLTTDPYVKISTGVYGDNSALGTSTPNARRLQVPTLIAYNKDAAQPVTHEWLHKDSTSTDTTTTYSEYMLELAWVRHTQPALDATATHDGLSDVQFADEAVAALDNVLVPVKNYVAAYSLAPLPTVTGAAKAGQVVSASLGTWFPVPDSLTYQWYAGNVAIPGATGSSYQISAADVGKTVAVKVTGTKDGFPALSKTSKQTDVVTGTFAKSPAPKITGSVRIGKTLKVVTGTWSPKPTFTYQWYANGKKISKATKASFKLTKSLKGKRITVVVTANKQYYSTLIRTSTATSKVKK